MRGRIPTPTALKELRGNPGRRPLNAAEPVLVIAEVSAQPPENLTDLARKEWDRLIPILTASRIMTVGDLAVFALYCQYFAEWQEYDFEMRTNAVKGPYKLLKQKKADGTDGDVYAFWNPARTVRDAAADRCARYAAELGLTPSARSRVKQSGERQDKGKTVDELRRLLRA